MPPIIRLANALLLSVYVTGGMTVLNARGYVNKQTNQVTWRMGRFKFLKYRNVKAEQNYRYLFPPAGITKTGQLAPRKRLSMTLSINMRDKPPRPCEDMTIGSAGSYSAQSTMAAYAWPVTTAACIFKSSARRATILLVNSLSRCSCASHDLAEGTQALLENRQSNLTGSRRHETN